MGRLALGLIVSLWVIPISIMVNLIVPDPYMDEIFHVPQAQEYCKSNFRSWDPMITTPPGLGGTCSGLAAFYPSRQLTRAILKRFKIENTCRRRGIALFIKLATDL